MSVNDIKKKIMYILGGTVFTEDFFWKNARFIITVLIILLFYISNRYSCIEKRARIEKLQTELKDAKYESLTISAKVIGLSRESRVRNVIQQKEIDLENSKEPIYKIER